MKLRFSYSILLIVLLLTACVKMQKESSNNSVDTIYTPVDSAEINPTEKAYWVGDYKGTMPCEDCEGVATSIRLNEDSTYTQQTEYIGKGDPVTDQGKCRWNDDGTIISLISGDGSQQDYLLQEGSLTLLDSQGRVPEGELASEYVLKKQ